MIESDRPKRATRANRSQAWDEVQRLACERVASAPPDAACHRRAIEQSYGTGAVRVVQLHRGGGAGRAWAAVPVGLAIAIVLLVLLLSGCANPIDPALRRTMVTIEERWPVIRDASAPAAGVDSADYAAAVRAMDHAAESGGRAARAE